MGIYLPAKIVRIDAAMGGTLVSVMPVSPADGVIPLHGAGVLESENRGPSRHRFEQTPSLQPGESAETSKQAT